MMAPYEFTRSTETSESYEYTTYTYMPNRGRETASLTNYEPKEPNAFQFERQHWLKASQPPYTITIELARELAKIGILENLILNSEVSFEKGALKELLKSPTLRKMDLSKAHLTKTDLLDLAETTKQLEKLTLKDFTELKDKEVHEVEVAFLKNMGILAIEFKNQSPDSSESRISDHAQANAARRLQANLTFVLAANAMANANSGALMNHILPLMSEIANFLPQPQISYYDRLADAIHSYEERYSSKSSKLLHTLFSSESKEEQSFIQDVKQKKNEWTEKPELAEEAVANYLNTNSKTALAGFLHTFDPSLTEQLEQAEKLANRPEIK